MESDTAIARTSSTSPSAMRGIDGAGRRPASSGFQSALQQAQAPAANGAWMQVQKGDTLVGLVKSYFRQQGQTVGDVDAYRMALAVARDNGLDNPNRVVPGQQLRMDGLGSARAAASAVAAAPSQPVRRAAPVAPASATPVLDRMLQRAHDKGYLPAADIPLAKERILAMAQNYRFSADDFARVALMESDGLNPQASNGRCFGILQFCGGKGRGADSVGFAYQPQAIADLGVLEQLDLADRYFKDVGLGQRRGRLGLDDLYLSVLMPAARAERNPQAVLGIPGRQALALYREGDVNQGITRESLSQGLRRQAQQLLAQTAANAPVVTAMASGAGRGAVAAR
jgi:hypothetical protein